METRLATTSALGAALSSLLNGSGDNPLAIADDAGVPAARGVHPAPITKGALHYWRGRSNLATSPAYLTGSQDG